MPVFQTPRDTDCFSKPEVCKFVAFRFQQRHAYCRPVFMLTGDDRFAKSAMLGGPADRDPPRDTPPAQLGFRSLRCVASLQPLGTLRNWGGRIVSQYAKNPNPPMKIAVTTTVWARRIRVASFTSIDRMATHS